MTNFGVVLPKRHSSYQMDVGWRKVSWNTLKQADFPSEIIQSFITKLKQPRVNKIIFNQLVSERIIRSFQKQSYSTQLQWLYLTILPLMTEEGPSGDIQNVPVMVLVVNGTFFSGITQPLELDIPKTSHRTPCLTLFLAHQGCGMNLLHTTCRGTVEGEVFSPAMQVS